MIEPMKRVGAFLLITGCILYSHFAEAQTAKAVAVRTFPSVVLLLMEDSQGQPLSLGSGFFVEGGYVATNAHVIRGASRGTVKLIGRPDKAEITGIAAANTERDLVILAIKGLSGPALPIGKSKSIAVGEEVYAIGNPQGLEGTISQGIVSGVRHVSATEILQITAPISPGSSGGPVLNQNGQVIGVAVATFRGGQNLNFAIPIDYLTPLIIQPKTSSPLRALPAKQQSKSILSELGPKSTEGVAGSALLCSDPQDSSTVTCTWSLVNKLRSPVRDVHHLVILWSKDGQPLDAQERRYEGVIQPSLAVRFQGYIVIDANLKKITSKIEVRILNFIIDDSN